MHYSVDTTSKFAFFADSDIEEADPDELLQKAKREKETEKLAKEKAKKEEKDKNKKSKAKEVLPVVQPQPQANKPKEGTKVQNAQNNKPPRLNRPKTDDQVHTVPSLSQPADEDTSSQKPSFEQPNGFGSLNDRPFRGRGGYRGGRGRIGFARDDPAFQGFSEGNVMGESGEFRRGGFRGRGPRRGAGVHPQDRHSGSRITGVKAIEKRNGAGAHNWGSEQDELDLIDSEKLQAGIVEVHSEAANVPGDINADENIPPTSNDLNEATEEKAVEGETSEEPTGPKDMTLQEYMAKCADERSRLNVLISLPVKKPKKKAPVVVEGKDSSFKGMVAYIKNTTPEDESDDEDYEEGDDYEENPKRKRTLDVPFLPNRSGGGRGTRGRGRGRGADFRGGRGRGIGRGGSAQGRDEDIQLQLTSDVDFPCL